MNDDVFVIKEDIYDSAYKSALSNMLDNILKLSLLNDNLALVEVVKESFESNSLFYLLLE